MDARTSEFAVADAKARFSDLIARAEEGEEIVIKRHGKPVAKLVPVQPAKPEMTEEERLRFWEEWIELRSKQKITLGPDLTIKQLISEGRR